MYLDVNGSSSGTRNFDIRGHQLPGGVTANLDLNLKGSIVTLAGEYALLADPASSVDVLVGARLIDIKENLGYQISADVGQFTGPGRSGNSDAKGDKWDAIVGVKGRLGFGAESRVVRSVVSRHGYRPDRFHVAGPAAASATTSSGAR